MSTSERDAMQIVKAMRMVSKLHRASRSLLRITRALSGCFEQWTRAEQDAALVLVLGVQDDPQGWYSDALCSLSSDDWQKIGENLRDGNTQQTGQLIHDALRRAYAELMATIIDEA